MSTTITINVGAVADAVQPVLDALDSILQSTVVPLQSQLACSKQLNSPLTQVIYTFPDSVPNDQVWNFYRRVKLETGILGTKLTETTPAGIPQALSAAVFEVPAYGQPV